MRSIESDPNLARYAARSRSLRASAIRALFAVASRPEIVNLSGGSPFTAALNYDAVNDVVAGVLHDEGPTALQYGGGQGLPALRERLVEVMASEEVPARADDLVVTVGGQQGLDLVTKLFCDPGDVIIAEGPTYVGALAAFSAYEATVVHVPMDAEGMVPSALAERLEQLQREGRTPKFLYVIPNHQNPAGVSMSSERRHHVLDIAERHNLLVVEDNPYGLLDFKGELRPSLRALAPERVVYIGTLSKIFSPGIRVGWIAAPQGIRDRLILLKEAADLCQSNLTQYIAERWLATQPWMAQVEEYREVYRERCAALLDSLTAELPTSCRFTEPTGGFFVWVHLPRGVDSGELLAKAINARVAFVPGAGFYADGTGSDYLRLSFCFPPPDVIREGARRLGEVLHAEIELLRAMYGEDHA